MNIIETIDNFKFSNTFYLFPIKNTVILDSNFIRILYSNNLFTLNGVYISICLENITSNDNKLKYCFDKEINKKTTEFIKNLETVIYNEINPMLESHGGDVSLVKFTEAGEVILQFGGGCQGCGMVDVTLKDGIEKTLLEQIPELKSVKDSTDHSIDDNAYYK